MFTLLSGSEVILRVSDLKEYPCRDVLASKLKDLELYFFDKEKTLWFTDYRENTVFKCVAVYKSVLDCSFISFLRDSSEGVKAETYYINKEKLPYIYKDIIFDESDRKICVLDGIDFKWHGRGLLTKEGLGL